MGEEKDGVRNGKVCVCVCGGKWWVILGGCDWTTILTTMYNQDKPLAVIFVG